MVKESSLRQYFVHLAKIKLKLAKLGCMQIKVTKSIPNLILILCDSTEFELTVFDLASFAKRP